ncbi:MAG: excinuclease ABC subunit C [Desulfovibrio sp. S3730MH75]|nr:MAG: excinuclease ABC subunit C [Desulfovibrio sp. S3730MH75]
MNTWHVYLLRCSDNSLYCGVTTDPERRLAEHNKGDKKGAKYTRARRPVTIETVEELPDKRSAYRLEYAVKKQQASQKMAFLKKTAIKMREEYQPDETELAVDLSE